MKTLNQKFVLAILCMAFLVTACNDNVSDADEPAADDIEAIQGQQATQGLQQKGGANLCSNVTVLDAVVSGRTIRNLELPLIGSEEFTGRIVNLKLTEGSDPGTVLASGKVIGYVNGDRINQRFEDILLRVYDENCNIIDGNGVCQILFLELGPIFVDVLGSVVDVSDPIVVEIRAERGPSSLLGKLLCSLVGISN